MAEPANKREEILDAAEAMMRSAGYNGFSTRDVASQIGIKAASVHYHFPTKADIGAAVTDRYTNRFIKGLGDPTRFGDEREAIAFYVEAFRSARAESGKLCLCAVLGAETGGLPEPVSAKARHFFERNMNWLNVALAGGAKHGADPMLRAATIIAGLEGAMILATSLGDEALFNGVADQVSRWGL